MEFFSIAYFINISLCL